MKKEIIAFFKKYPSKYFKSKEIAKKLDINQEWEYSSLKATIYNLYEEGFLQKEGKKYRLFVPLSQNKITGELTITQGGYGFVLTKNSKIGDIFIAEKNLGTAFHGDTVEVSLFAQTKGKNIEGQVLRIVKRKREEVVGTLRKSKLYFVSPDENHLHKDFYVDAEKLIGAKVNDKVIIGNIKWDNPKLNPEAEIIEVLGKTGSIDTETVSIAKDFELPYKFPDEVLYEAEKLTIKIPLEEIEKRLDYRGKNVFTIDPEDAKDFDDALSLEILENGNYSVGVHIADVDHYIERNSFLDKEALNRGNSVYLVGKVIPMLPEKLSNGICSLVPYEDRLTYSVIVEITPRGRLVDYVIKKSIINSKRRFSYEEAQKVIESGEGDLSNELIKLNNLAKTLRKKRIKEGSIDFFSAEVKFVLDEQGTPVEVIKKEIKDSNMLIEEYMLLANKITAKHIAVPNSGQAKPFIYRVHDLPDNEKLFDFAKFVKTLGYKFDPNAKSKTNQFQVLMEEVKGKEEESVISELAIRSMSKAVYSADNIGHYGLGFKFYTHFTSPIRRYSDLMVHRLLFEYLETGKRKKGTSYTYNDLQSISEHISTTERTAVEAERYSVKTKQVEYLMNHIGDEFHAIISGVTSFGLFVKLTDILSEGLIKMRDLDDDYYIYNEKKYELMGRKTKKVYRLGDKVQVKLIRVDQEKSEIDFLILEQQA